MSAFTTYSACDLGLTWPRPHGSIAAMPCQQCILRHTQVNVEGC